jgi:hypothetical protein
VNSGPSLDTFHEGQDILMFRDWDTDQDTFQVGGTWKPLKRTSLSFDQYWSHLSTATTWVAPESSFDRSIWTGADLNLGFIWYTNVNTPCSPAVLATIGTAVNPNCAGVLMNDPNLPGRGGHQRSNPHESDFPTTMLSFQSSDLKWMDFAGRFIYSDADNNSNINEQWTGWVGSRTRQRAFDIGGPASVRRVQVTADANWTFHITDSFRVLESMRWTDFRIPGTWNESESSLFGPALGSVVNIYSPATCNPVTGVGCPQHGTGTLADVINADISRYLGQDAFTNVIEAQYDFGRMAGVRLGWKLLNREITFREQEIQHLTFYPSTAVRGACADNPLTRSVDPVTGVCTVTVGEDEVTSFQESFRENGLLFGAWYRPVRQLKLDFDLELSSNDGVINRIEPRNYQQYRARVEYRPLEWLNFVSNFNILENRNNEPTIQNLQHRRAFGFAVDLAPRDWFAVDLGFDYDDTYAQSIICIIGASDPGDTDICSAGPTGQIHIPELSLYDADTKYGFINLTLRPVKRLTTQFGYNVSAVNGEATIFNPYQPQGPTTSTYHQPMALVTLDVARGISFRGGWNGWRYDEGGGIGATLPRDFSSNVGTISLRYKF